MKKVSITIPTAEWGQVKSKYSSDSLYVSLNDFTNGTINIDTMPNGALGKVKGGTNYNTTPLTTAPKDQYEAIFADGVHHLLALEGGRLSYSPGDTTFTEVTSGYSATSNFEFAMALDRVYFGNGLTNQVYDRTSSYGGVTYTAPKTKAMGCQVPGSAPVASLVADSTASQVPAGGHTYKVTYLYYGFEESNGSAASNVVTNDGTHTKNSVTLPVGGYGVTARKIYRDDNDGNYVLIATVQDNTTTSYTDLAQLGGALIPLDNGIPPHFGLIAPFLDRLFLAKISGEPYNIYYTAPGFPDIVYGTNFFPCNQGDPIMAIVVYLGRIIVLNRNSVGQVLGTTSDTFRYQNIQTGVGCTDCRSVQVRTINGVPTLVWLSDKGFYTYNGSSISYLSDAIEDLVNFNIQQAQTVLGSNAQTTKNHFSGGTASNGILLDASTIRGTLQGAPGSITVPNPKRLWDDQGDWAGGLQTNNCATKDGSNTLKVPTKNRFSGAAGVVNNVTASDNSIQLTTTGYQVQIYEPLDHDFVDIGGSGTHPAVGMATKVKFTYPGTLASLTMYLGQSYGITLTQRVVVYRDLVGAPGAELFSQTFTVPPRGATPTAYPVTVGPNVHLDAGFYWFSIEEQTTIWNSLTPVKMSRNSGSDSIPDIKRMVDGQWMTMQQAEAIAQFSGTSSYGFHVGEYPVTMPFSMTFNQDTHPTSGQWTSATFDSLAGSTSGMSLVLSGFNDTGTSYIAYIEGSNNATDVLPTWTVTSTVNNPNGTYSLSGSGYRYWRVRLSLSTADSRKTPSLNAPSLKFATSVAWISEVIDLTLDATALNALDLVTNLPAGTSVVATVATSDYADFHDNPSFVALGSAVVKQYLKVKLTLGTDSGNTVTPTVSSATLKWTIVANLQSSIINCGATPAGWDVFQTSDSGNGGVIAYKMRSASSSGAVSGASYGNVSNGAFPTVAANQYVQWQVLLTATADNVPMVDSVTVNWFVSNTNSIRPASLFFNRNYYLAVAEFSQTKNNVVLELDGNNNWRVLRGFNIATLGLFFNKPYYGSAVNGQFVGFLNGLTIAGTNIEWDVRTKALDFSTQYDQNAGDAQKYLRTVTLTGLNTGATITPYFSVDNGTTWLPLHCEEGTSSFTTTSDGSRFVRALTPVFADGNVVTGRTIMFRLYNNDQYAVEIHKFKLDAIVRKGQVYT